MKKITLIIVTACLMLGGLIVGEGAAIAEEASGPLEPESGTLTIHKYLGDELNDNEHYPANGEKLTVGLPASITPVKGVVFYAYKIGAPIDPEEDTPARVSSSMDGWEYKRISDDMLEVSKETKTYRYGLSNKTKLQTDDNGDVTSVSLEKGDYFVYEDLNESEPKIKENGSDKEVTITKPATPFVVSVPMTKQNGTGWITDVHVYPKNQETDVVKEAAKPSVTIGDSLNWTITVELPEDIDEYQKLEVADKLDAVLDYADSSVKVYQAIKESGIWKKATPENELETDKYTVTDPTVENDRTLMIDIKDFSKLDKWQGLIVEFATTVNENVQSNIVGNTGSVEFTNKEGQISSKKSNEEKINTGYAEINKVDQEKKPLAGAVFQIASSKSKAGAGKFLKIDNKGKILDEGDTGYENANKWEQTSALNGDNSAAIAKFDGLATHKKDKSPISYWIVETKAPASYNLLGAPQQVTFPDYDDDATKRVNVEIIVENRRGFVLPSTGGPGAILFAIAGVVLIGVGIILKIIGKKEHA